MLDPRDGVLISGSNPSLFTKDSQAYDIPLLFFVLHQVCGSQPDRFPFLPTRLPVDLSLQAWLQKISSAGPQVDLSESHFIHSCSFDVLMKGSEPNVLLFCHLDLSFSQAFLKPQKGICRLNNLGPILICVKSLHIEIQHVFIAIKHL